MKREEFTMDYDYRGDMSIFIEKDYLNEWKIKDEYLPILNEFVEGDDEEHNTLFFRVINSGKESTSHGWINVITGEITQWG